MGRWASQQGWVVAGPHSPSPGDPELPSHLRMRPAPPHIPQLGLPSALPASRICTLPSVCSPVAEAQKGGATGPGLHSSLAAELSGLCPWLHSAQPQPQAQPQPPSLCLLWPQPPGIAGLVGTRRHWPGPTKCPLPPGRVKSPSQSKSFPHTLQRPWPMAEPL